MVGDAVPFAESIAFDIEHGWTNDVEGVYGSTAYWYGTDRPATRRTDTLTVGDPASERAHGYTGGGEPATLDSAFEGDFRNTPPYQAVHRVTADPVSFTLKLDRQNRGAELRRMGDQSLAGQHAEVTVNGRRLADWVQPLGNQSRRWLEDVYQIPADVTAAQEHDHGPAGPEDPWVPGQRPIEGSLASRKRPPEGAEGRRPADVLMIEVDYERALSETELAGSGTSSPGWSRRARLPSTVRRSSWKGCSASPE
ncbi:hypothetical protein GCM10020220_049980 [Nonomuraea rubra]